MTEAEWLACDDPRPMLEFVRGKVSDRKLRLLVVACCRSVWHLLTDDRSRRAIEVAERFADGTASDVELASAWEAAGEVSPAEHGGAARDRAWRNAHAAAWYAAEADVPDPAAWHVVEAAVCVVLLRDLFGTVMRPRVVDQRWLTSAVVPLAQSIYDERTFERLPVLADALEDAGCTDADVLSHCRGPGPHVRGCWVVDLLLGKS